MGKPISQIKRDPVTFIYFSEVSDYFSRLGGAGRYNGFQEWHPLVMTIGCGLEATGKYTPEELEMLWRCLPGEIINKCDGLKLKVAQAFERELFLIDDKLDCVRVGITSLIEYLSQGRRHGRSMNNSDLRMVEEKSHQYLVKIF